MFKFCLLLIVVLYFWLNRKNKHNILFLLPLVIMIIIMGGNINNLDTQVYYDIYYGQYFFSKDYLFGILVDIFSYFNVTLNEFRLLISAFGLVLIFSTVRKYSTSMLVFILLYISFPFFYDIVQVRNFLGVSLVVFAVPYLLTNNKINTLFGICLILSASLIQKTHLIWFIFIFISYFLKNKKIIHIFVISCFMFSFLFLFPTFYNILGDFLKGLNLNGLSYFVDRDTRFGWSVNWLIQLVNLIILCYIDKKMQNLNISEKERKICNFIYKINIASTICLPLYILNSTFARILRNCMILDFINISIFFKNNKFKNREEKLFFVVMLLLYFVYVFCSTFVIDGLVQELVFKVFQIRNNWIINMII